LGSLFHQNAGVTTPSEPAAPDGAASASAPSPAGPQAVRRALRRASSGGATVLAVIAAGAAGWFLAGPPDDAAALVPPACPASADVATGSAAGPAADVVGAVAEPGYLAGVPQQLVPMPLPQPRGPVSVRICRYAGGGDGSYRLSRSVVVEPTRTAALAGLMDKTPGATPAPGCLPGANVDVLVFRYTEGLPLRVEVLGGRCALVRTPARAESGRQDVVRAIDALLGTSPNG
jgi:hypothetical protein